MSMFEESIETPIFKVSDEIIEKFGVELYIKREDLTNPIISGNKYRKLKYNLIYAKERGFDTLLTFGGAYSNHIHAVAYAGCEFGFNTIGVIRGEATHPLNATLKDAARFNMKFHYVSRSDYRNKSDPAIVENLEKQFGKIYIIPEGGSNFNAVKGCTEILNEHEKSFDHICCSCGTGGTIAGIATSMNGLNSIWGFPALKNGGFLENDIKQHISNYSSNSYSNWNLILDYHFGGYAKYTPDLIDFINSFKERHLIQLDPIYTGKMLFGIYDKIKQGFFLPNDKILAIHTGGLQGIKGFNERHGNLLK